MIIIKEVDYADFTRKEFLGNLKNIFKEWLIEESDLDLKKVEEEGIDATFNLKDERIRIKTEIIFYDGEFDGFFNTGIYELNKGNENESN